ncbi:MAG TPA: ABC transporter permease [Gemmatimonadales bacterium]
MRSFALRFVVAIAIAVLLVILALPLVALLVRVSPGALWHYVRQPIVVEALKLSLLTSVIATIAVVVLGVPVAYLLATHHFRGKRLVEVLVELPIVLPPTVAGVGLLLAFGRAGIAGRILSAAGISIPFTTLAVVIAQLFVATPYFIAAVVAGLREVEPRYRDVAMTLRATPLHVFRRVLLPIALPSVLAGAAMSWARALGEFGATITFAGNLMGRTQTMPLAVYSALQTDLDSAVALAVLLILFSFAILAGLRFAPWGAAIGGKERNARGRRR